MDPLIKKIITEVVVRAFRGKTFVDWSALGVKITTLKDNRIFGWLFKESNQEINEKKYLFELVLWMKMN